MKKNFYINKLVKEIIFLLIYTILLTSLSFADTHIAGGSVSGTWKTGNSPYIINGEIEIPVDSTLIIEPGIQVVFSGHYKFNIYGTLLAEGTELDTINFTIVDTTGFSNPDTTAGGWHGLRFYDIDTNEQDSSKIVHCKFEYGKAIGDDRFGGAIYCERSSDILIKNCLIRNNRADDYGKGGGIYCYYSSPAISYTTVSSNTSSYMGGGIYLQESYPYLVNVTISRNYAARNGGGIYCDYSNPILQDVIINENSTDSTYLNAGGGIYCYHSSPILDRVIINNNNSYYGGGIYFQTSSPILANVTICGNTANCGGGIYCNDTSCPNLSNVTISENFANHGGGIGCRHDSSPVLMNCIVWNNQVEEFYLVYGSTITITYSDIMDGWTGEGNINEDPLFEDPAHGDFHLTEYSPCIDAGNPASVPDPDGTIIDMGAYYFHQNNVIPPTVDFCADVTAGNAPLTVHFTDTSYPGNSDIASWYWNFGDSTFSDEQNPIHTYDSLGIYTVSLRVITENNGISTETKTDYISAYGSGFHIPGGDVSGVWIANFSPYIIDGNIQIQLGDSLLIESGVEVLFSGHYECDIFGRLLAIGTEGNSILFTAQDTLSGWKGLRFYDTNTNGQDSSKIVYCKFEYGNSSNNGGALYLKNSSDILIKNSLITHNSAADYGGGISCDNSSPKLMGVTLYGNSAHLGGGGIYLIDSYPVFNSENRCNIFMNYANHGNDLYAFQCSTVNVIVDTFTVFAPDNHFASPIDNFTFDILNGKIEPIEQDLYVSPYGSNDNSGLSPDDPLRTISYALVKIAPNEQDPHTIHCANGLYSFSETGEVFPLNCRSYVFIHGEDEDYTILDGEEKYGVVFCRYDTVVTMENMTVKNGNSPVGSGIYCYESILDLNNMTITENGTSSDKGYVSQDIKNNKNKEILKPASNYSKIDNPLNDTCFMPVNNKLNEALSLLEDCLDEGRNFSLGGGIFCSRSTLKITNATISFNNAEGCYGGGIYYEYANSILSNVEITGNTGEFGCGIYSSHSSLNLYNTIISANTAYYINGYSLGGGFCSYKSTSSLINILIDQNSGYGGGGIYSEEDSLLSLSNVTISNNSATFGGGIYCNESSPDLFNIDLYKNYAGNGGALYLYNCSPYLSNVTITDNRGKYCGGITCDNATVLFDTENLCNIFLNYGGWANEFYFNYNCPVMDVIIDTFTVLQPDVYFAYPFDYFNFDVINAKVEPVNHDLYVSPAGFDNNSGLTPDDPLKTIAYAFVKIVPNEINPHTIHCANGVYSFSETDEKFPLNCRSYVSINGENEQSTIFNGDNVRGILQCWKDYNFTVKNLTIMNGNSTFGGGIYCSHSSMDIAHVNLKDNYADALGGGILYWDSNSTMRNVTINGNTAEYGRGGGISCDDYSTLSVINGLIYNNISESGGGLSCYDNSSMNCTNLTIANNTATSGGGIYGSDIGLLNCIHWDNSPQEIPSSSVIATYSDIQGGWTGEGNIDADPLFLNPDDGNFQITSGSPCIDAGIPDTTGLHLPQYDLNGDPRIYNGIIDMGCYEWQGVAVDEEPVQNSTILTCSPNPFSSSTTISIKFNHPTSLRSVVASELSQIKIYNIKGQLLRKFLLVVPSPDLPVSVTWDGRDESGKEVKSGVYFCTLQNGEKQLIKKLVLVR